MIEPIRQSLSGANELTILEERDGARSNLTGETVKVEAVHRNEVDRAVRYVKCIAKTNVGTGGRNDDGRYGRVDE